MSVVVSAGSDEKATMEQDPENLDAIGCIRTRKVLSSLGIHSVMHLCAVSPRELMAARHARPRCLEVVRRYLDGIGMSDSVQLVTSPRPLCTGYDIWPLIDRRLYQLQADTRHVGRDRYFVRSSLMVASNLVADAARRHSPVDLGRRGVEQVLGPEDEPSFELRLWRVLRAVSYERSSDPARKLFMQLVWAFMDAVAWDNFRLAAACTLACCKGAEEWKSATELIWGRIVRELDRRHPECQGVQRTWPAEFESLSEAMRHVMQAWHRDDPMRSLKWLAGSRGVP